jgi:hypothetical protein
MPVGRKSNIELHFADEEHADIWLSSRQGNSNILESWMKRYGKQKDFRYQ